MIEKFTIKMTDEQMKNPIIRNEVRIRKKINEIIDQREMDKKNRDEQMKDLTNKVKDLESDLSLLISKLKEGFKK